MAGCVNLTVTTVGVYSLYSCWTAVGRATWLLHSKVNFTAATCWRTRYTAEEAARVLSNEISDKDGLDDLFTVDDLDEQDECREPQLYLRFSLQIFSCTFSFHLLTISISWTSHMCL